MNVKEKRYFTNLRRPSLHSQYGSMKQQGSATMADEEHLLLQSFNALATPFRVETGFTENRSTSSTVSDNSPTEPTDFVDETILPESENIETYDNFPTEQMSSESVAEVVDEVIRFDDETTEHVVKSSLVVEDVKENRSANVDDPTLSTIPDEEAHSGQHNHDTAFVTEKVESSHATVETNETAEPVETASLVEDVRVEEPEMYVPEFDLNAFNPEKYLTNSAEENKSAAVGSGKARGITKTPKVDPETARAMLRELANFQQDREV